MATAANIKYNVDCGVAEDNPKKITLMYYVPDKKDRISWEWDHQLAEDGSNTHVAHMVAQDSKCGHKSRAIPDDVYKKLGASPKKERDSKYFKVTLTRKDGVSIKEYFHK